MNRDKPYRVKHKGSRAFERFSTKARALAHARHSLRAGATKACIDVQKHDGSWLRIRCMTRRRRTR